MPIWEIIYTSPDLPVENNQIYEGSQITGSLTVGESKEDADVSIFKALVTLISRFIPTFIFLYIEFGVFILNILFAGFIGDASFIKLTLFK